MNHSTLRSRLVLAALATLASSATLTLAVVLPMTASAIAA
jgi:hypothetical protein